MASSVSIQTLMFLAERQEKQNSFFFFAKKESGERVTVPGVAFRFSLDAIKPRLFYCKRKGGGGFERLQVKVICI